MKVKITKTRDGQLTEVYDHYDTKEEAEQILCMLWNNLQDVWDMSEDSNDRLEKDLMIFDVYTYRIEKV